MSNPVKQETEQDRTNERLTLDRFCKYLGPDFTYIQTVNDEAADAVIYQDGKVYAFVECSSRNYAWGTFELIIGRSIKKMNEIIKRAEKAEVRAFFVTRWNYEKIYAVQLDFFTICKFLKSDFLRGRVGDTADQIYKIPARMFFKVAP